MVGKSRWWLWGTAALIVAVVAATRCAPSAPKSKRGAPAQSSDLAVAALKTYVAPGDLVLFKLHIPRNPSWVIVENPIWLEWGRMMDSGQHRTRRGVEAAPPETSNLSESP